jgi:hypothetical protein
MPRCSPRLRLLTNWNGHQVEEALNTMELAKAAMHAQKEEKDAAISALQADVRTSNEQREAAANVHQQQVRVTICG